MTQPTSVTFDGTDLVLWVPSIADIDAPGISELTDPAVLDLSCYFAEAGWNPDLTEADVPDNRLCSIDNYADGGRIDHSLPLVYVTNPTSPSNDLARTTLVKGATGFLVERPGVDYRDAIQVGDLVSVWSVKTGMQKLIDRTANTKWRVSQMARLQPPGHRLLVAVAAS